jgi:hypothetical protein
MDEPTLHICPRCGDKSLRLYLREVNRGPGRAGYQYYNSCLNCGHAGYVTEDTKDHAYDPPDWFERFHPQEDSVCKQCGPGAQLFCGKSSPCKIWHDWDEERILSEGRAEPADYAHESLNKGWKQTKPAFWTGDLNDPNI